MSKPKPKPDPLGWWKITFDSETKGPRRVKLQAAGESIFHAGQDDPEHPECRVKTLRLKASDAARCAQHPAFTVEKTRAPKADGAASGLLPRMMQKPPTVKARKPKPKTGEGK